MTKDERFHIALQFLAIPFVIFAIHRERSGRLQRRCLQHLFRKTNRSRSILPDGRRKTLEWKKRAEG